MYLFIFTGLVGYDEGRIICTDGKGSVSTISTVFHTPPASPSLCDHDALSSRMRNGMFALKDFKKVNSRESPLKDPRDPRAAQMPPPKLDNNNTICCVVACCDSQSNVYVEDEHYRGVKERF